MHKNGWKWTNRIGKKQSRDMLLTNQTSFLKMGQPRPLFQLFSSFRTKNKCEKCHADPVNGVGIWTHDLWNMSPPITTRPGLPHQTSLIKGISDVGAIENMNTSFILHQSLVTLLYRCKPRKETSQIGVNYFTVYRWTSLALPATDCNIFNN